MFKLEDPSQLTAATVVGAAGGRGVRLSAAQSKIFFWPVCDFVITLNVLSQKCVYKQEQKEQFFITFSKYFSRMGCPGAILNKLNYDYDYWKKIQA